MKSDQLRSRFLEFFRRKDHKVFPSDSLVPEGDQSLLFTGAGMNQFKDAFLGKGPKGLTRATSVQKCLRMPDLDNVGRTPSHHTFFEMLGNFSFGDYFKREAIFWAMEFLERELNLPRERLAATVYLDDDEAFAIWEKEVGLPKERIWRFGEKDNFWPAEAPSQGPNGPCGPCSEIYFDFGTEASTVTDGHSDPASDGGRYVEIWNLVFTQYDRVGVNDLQPLPRKNIDTGAGFERMLRVLQGRRNNFETDLFRPLLAAIAEVSGSAYGDDAGADVRIKRIADHVRAAAFCIADGVRPSNEGRGYVVRKIIRRAGMDLRELGRQEPGLARVVPAVTSAMGAAYGELVEREALIGEIINTEEERFAEVYSSGIETLRQMLEGAAERRLAGAQAFFLWDTIGFPFDITARYCAEHGFTVDEAGFAAEMAKQRERARQGSRISGEIFDTGPAARLKGRVEPTEFIGYDAIEGEATVLALLDGAGDLLDGARQGDGPVTLVLDRTPFYGESGGQVGDAGSLSAAGVEGHVHDTTRAEGYVLHRAEITRGAVHCGDRIVARVAAERRDDIRRNHTATHLLHWALRKVLGAETTQAGSLVHPDYLRFDYTAKSALSREQAEQIEDLVNGRILASLQVAVHEQSFQEARAAGAIALFGEKYGDSVRVVRVIDEVLGRDWESVELCGGTHCRNTGEIGLLQIVSDGAIAAGVRRIVALTGRGALAAARERLRSSRELAELLKSPEAENVARVEALLKEKSRLEKELARQRRATAAKALDGVLGAARDLGGVQLFRHVQEGAGQEELRVMADTLVTGESAAVALLAGVVDDKIHLVVACGKGAQKHGLKAGDLVKGLGKALGGGGGGRPDLAQGQGSDRAALDGALDQAESAIRERLTGA